MQQIKLIHRDKVNKGPDADKLRQLFSSPLALSCFLWVASGDIVHKTVMRKTDSEGAKDAASFEGSSRCFYVALTFLFWKMMDSFIAKRKITELLAS